MTTCLSPHKYSYLNIEGHITLYGKICHNYHTWQALDWEVIGRGGGPWKEIAWDGSDGGGLPYYYLFSLDGFH